MRTSSSPAHVEMSPIYRPGEFLMIHPTAPPNAFLCSLELLQRALIVITVPTLQVFASPPNSWSPLYVMPPSRGIFFSPRCASAAHNASSLYSFLEASFFAPFSLTILQSHKALFILVSSRTEGIV